MFLPLAAFVAFPAFLLSFPCFSLLLVNPLSFLAFAAGVVLGLFYQPFLWLCFPSSRLCSVLIPFRIFLFMVFVAVVNIYIYI